jgi:hypothetical protein
MITTRRQQAMDLIDKHNIDSDDFLQFLVNDYMGGGELLSAVLSFLNDEMGIDTDEEVE